jgi:2-polyprenyl-3-methyl-5-hydroxy-6-metoxy-1,4-benzoquinol methylase
MNGSDGETLEKRDHGDACTLCGQNDSEIVYESLSTLRRCVHCGHVYTARFTAQPIYTESYFRGEDGESSYDFFGTWGRLYDKVRFPMGLRHIRKYAASGKVLDMGCGVGNFLKFMHETGYEPYGLDVSTFAVDFVKKEYGFPVVQGTLDAVPQDWGKFRVVTLHHVLEHVPDPVSCLTRNVTPLLQEDGIAVIEVPNFGSIDSHVEGADWEDLKIDQHASHFTVATLKRCVSQAGMEVVESYTYSPESHRLMWYYPYALRLLGIPRRVHKRFLERAGPARPEGPANKSGGEHQGFDSAHEAPPVRNPLPLRGQKGYFKRFLLTFLRLGTTPLASTYCALGLGKFIVLIARKGSAD